MKQEDKDLLLKDLCSRLPYGIYGNYLNSDGSLSDDKLLRRVKIGYHDLICADGHDGMVLNGFLKPYLFPLSSMTEEQSMEFALLQVNTHKDGFLYVCDCVNMMKWLLKNHFDIYGLIEKGLAINATNLNIY